MTASDRRDTQTRCRLLVIVPTRNRAELAVAAVESALAAETDRVRVLVSDNSNETSERAALDDACARLADERLRRMAPPEPLAMGAHWEWALAAALEETDWTHVAVLTDRMLFLPGAIDDLLALADRWPDEVISYNLDRVHDVDIPVSLEQTDWTGRVIEIPSAALLEASSGCIFVAALPRLLNSVTPRRVLERIRQAYGTICDSAAPDFRFAYRMLAAHPSVTYFDRPLLLQYALRRSNGFSLTRGVATRDSQDFERELQQARVQFASPLPTVCTAVNAVVHEYCSVREEGRREEGRGRPLPSLDVDAFFGAITREIDGMEPGEIQTALRDEVRCEMAAQGATAAPLSTVGGGESPVRRVIRGVSRASRRRGTLGATIRLLTGWFRERYEQRVTPWPNVAAAIRQARENARSAHPGKAKQEFILRDTTLRARRLQRR